MSLVLQSSGGGQITIQEPATASNFTQTLPAATGTVMVSGNMPTFSYYQSSAQTLSSVTFTKLTFTTSDWDTTSGMYSSSRFTPTVAGYYQVNAGLSINTATQVVMSLYKNGGEFKRGVNFQSGTGNAVSALVFLNGSTDYIEIYGYLASGQALNAGVQLTYFQAAMVRTA
jgi:hypothetical protein